MKKRMLVIPLALLLAISMVAIGCPPVEVVEVVYEVVPWPGYPEPQFTWRFQGHPPAGDLAAIAVWAAAEKITAMSGGRLVVEPFHGGAIWPTHEELMGVDAGVLDMGAASAMFKKAHFPQAGLFSHMAGMLTGPQKLLWHAYGGGDELAVRMWEDNWDVVFVGVLTHLRPEVWLHTNIRLECPEDLVGLKIRAAGDGAIILYRMGSAVVFFPGGEIFEAMKLGVIDAFEFASPAVNWGMGHQYIARYMYLSPSRAPTDSIHVWVHPDRWEELTPDLQMIVRAAIRTTAIDFLAMQAAKDDEAVGWFKDFGVEIHHVPQIIEEAFLKEAHKFYVEMAAIDQLFYDIIESMKSWKEIMVRQEIW